MEVNALSGCLGWLEGLLKFIGFGAYLKGLVG